MFLKQIFIYWFCDLSLVCKCSSRIVQDVHNLDQIYYFHARHYRSLITNLVRMSDFTL
ncbi:hypothetical protein KC19_6G210900 [Ceratodon purpureus]|uniref:Uncharacterized protein n=1 Tax=Ceratodon purpureus TaxID=3225 RepID=A0A8T0HJX4_CERPU|nr:hypothetical protein KC19_6G210900 [Ceratodon purpureus]